ncbi:MAG: TonB-dependent receptor [Vicingaceae bacterium]
MKERLSVFVFLALSTMTLRSQVLTITDLASAQPLELVNLVSERPKAHGATNSKGQVDMSMFKGSEKIYIHLLNYGTQTFSYQELEAKGFLLSLEATSIDLDQISVVATRWNESAAHIPEKITSISASEVKLQNPQTAADMLALGGDVYIQKSQLGGGSPMIRGFATNRLLYEVDGVRMNTAIFRSGNIQNVISLDPLATERTEVLFGPGSVIYGSDAIGGVMSFRTLTPRLALTEDQEIAGNALSRASSASEELTGHLDLNVGWKKWASLTSMTFSDYGDLKMGSYGPDDYLRQSYVLRRDSDEIVQNRDNRLQNPSGYSQVNFMQKVLFDPGKKIKIQGDFHYSETSAYSRYDRHLQQRNGLPRYGEWDYGPQKWMMGNLGIHLRGKETFYDEVIIRPAYQFFEESRFSRNFRSAAREIRIEKVDAYSLNVDFDKIIGEGNDLSYGIEILRNDVRSIGKDQNIETGLVIPGPSRYPQSDWASYGVYINDRYEVSEKLSFQGGLRYNQYVMNAKFDTTFYPLPFSTASVNDGALTGSLGAVYRPDKTWKIMLNLATGFRAPNVDDLGKVFDSEPGAVVVPNPDLQAEMAYNIDAGIAKVFGDLLKVDITAYYTLLENAMVRRDYTLNGWDSIFYNGELSKVQAIQNAAQARVYGIQAGVDIKFPGHLDLVSRFNYQKGEEELDDGSTAPLRHAGPWFGRTGLTYSRNKWSLQAYALYNGHVAFADMPVGEVSKDHLYTADGEGNPYAPSWYTLNLKGMVSVTDDFSLTAGIENITDRRYRPYSSGIAAAGRNFILALRFSL